MKFIFLILLLSLSAQATNINPLKLPVWSDLEKYQSKAVDMIPLRNKDYIAFGGINYGFKNGIGLDAMGCKTLSRYLCAGARIFLGSLNSSAIVRSPAYLETHPTTSEMDQILQTSEHWFAFVPEIGLAVHTQILPLGKDLWSESSWFGIGRAFIGGRSGWAVSFEPGLNKKLSETSPFGWSIRAKYTFGWLYTKYDAIGTIPYDWFNLTAGIFYVW